MADQQDPSQPQYRAARPPVDPSAASAPPPPPPGGPMMYPPLLYPPPQKGGSWITRIITSLIVTLLIGSVFLNLYLGAAVVGLTSGPREAAYINAISTERIVILPIEGLIDDSTARFVHESLQSLRDNRPNALVLRVDSGGGYVGPSDQIWDMLAQFKKETGLPIIASFGSTAASGGYYVAASSDQIFAEPTTLTGSIGVIAQAFTVEQLLQKIGVTPEVIASTDSTKKDMLNPMRAWTEEDRDKLRSILDSAYNRFVEVVHQGRSKTGVSIDDVRALATGEAYTTEQAIQLKLVDGQGYLRDAIEAAKTAAGLSGQEVRVTRMGQPRGLGLSLLGAAPDTGAASLRDVTGRQLRGWVLELTAPQMLYQNLSR